VAFGTSGTAVHRSNLSFNETHVLAITQAISHYRGQKTSAVRSTSDLHHALSAPAFASALEVLCGNGVEVMTAVHDDTPTPAARTPSSTTNRGRTAGLRMESSLRLCTIRPTAADFKYNPPDGGGRHPRYLLDREPGKRFDEWLPQAPSRELILRRRAAPPPPTRTTTSMPT